jgi:MtN3 and saliva related transmembrane protein
MYYLKTGSAAQLHWLQIFEPVMVITGIVQPLATIPSITKLYFTHRIDDGELVGVGGAHEHDAQPASGQSLTTWLIFAGASLLWVAYGMLNRKAAIYVGNGDGFADGEWHPDECRMDILRLSIGTTHAHRRSGDWKKQS